MGFSALSPDVACISEASLMLRRYVRSAQEAFDRGGNFETDARVTNGHPIREEDFELFALGGFASDEWAHIQAHIDSCPECTRKLAEARGRIALLPLAAPKQNPPAAVKRRLLEKIRAENFELR